MKQYISRIVLMIVLSIAAVLSGCSKSPEMTMKEIEAKDGTFCISVEDSWIISDMGSVNEIAATSKGEEEGFLLTQFPVRATGISGVNSLEDVKKFIEKANQLSDITAMNEPEMQGMKHVEAYTASIQQVYSKVEKAKGAALYTEKQIMLIMCCSIITRNGRRITLSILIEFAPLFGKMR